MATVSLRCIGKAGRRSLLKWKLFGLLVGRALFIRPFDGFWMPLGVRGARPESPTQSGRNTAISRNEAIRKIMRLIVWHSRCLITGGPRDTHSCPRRSAMSSERNLKHSGRQGSLAARATSLPKRTFQVYCSIVSRESSLAGFKLNPARSPNNEISQRDGRHGKLKLHGSAESKLEKIEKVN